jgi:hypothetical protein
MAVAADPAVVAALRRKLADESASLASKYRVLFSLRNIEGSDAHAAMLDGAIHMPSAASFPLATLFSPPAPRRPAPPRPARRLSPEAAPLNASVSLLQG